MQGTFVLHAQQVGGRPRARHTQQTPKKAGVCLIGCPEPAEPGELKLSSTGICVLQ